MFTGPVKGTDVVAAPWTPHSSFTGADGFVTPEFCWAVMDFPGAWAFPLSGNAMLLGTMSAHIEKKMYLGEKYIITGWLSFMST